MRESGQAPWIKTSSSLSRIYFFAGELRSLPIANETRSVGAR